MISIMESALGFTQIEKLTSLDGLIKGLSGSLMMDPTTPEKYTAELGLLNLSTVGVTALKVPVNVLIGSLAFPLRA